MSKIIKEAIRNLRNNSIPIPEVNTKKGDFLLLIKGIEDFKNLNEIGVEKIYIVKTENGYLLYYNYVNIEIGNQVEEYSNLLEEILKLYEINYKKVIENGNITYIMIKRVAINNESFNKIPQRKLRDIYKEKYDNEEDTDFIIETSKKKFKVHKIMLMTLKSDFFDGILRSSMKESNESKVKFSESEEIVNYLIEYMYFGNKKFYETYFDKDLPLFEILIFSKRIDVQGLSVIIYRLIDERIKDLDEEILESLKELSNIYPKDKYLNEIVKSFTPVTIEDFIKKTLGLEKYPFKINEITQRFVSFPKKNEIIYGTYYISKQIKINEKNFNDEVNPDYFLNNDSIFKPILGRNSHYVSEFLFVKRGANLYTTDFMNLFDSLIYNRKIGNTEEYYSEKYPDFKFYYQPGSKFTIYSVTPKLNKEHPELLKFLKDKYKVKDFSETSEAIVSFQKLGLTDGNPTNLIKKDKYEILEVKHYRHTFKFYLPEKESPFLAFLDEIDLIGGLFFYPTFVKYTPKKFIKYNIETDIDKEIFNNAKEFMSHLEEDEVVSNQIRDFFIDGVEGIEIKSDFIFINTTCIYYYQDEFYIYDHGNNNFAYEPPEDILKRMILIRDGKNPDSKLNPKQQKEISKHLKYIEDNNEE